MKKGIIMAGFATVGKTFLSKKYENILDLESSAYKYDYSAYEKIDYEKLKGNPDRKRKKEWPQNYYNAIKEGQEHYDIIFIQLNLQHIEYFDKKHVEYYIVCPSLDSWEWVKQRAINRGNNESFLIGMEKAFKKYYSAAKKSKCKELLIVDEKTSLEDILKEKKFI